MNFLKKKKRSVFSFIFFYVLMSLFNFQARGSEIEFIMEALSSRHQTNETFMINSQKDLDLLIRDFMSSKFSDDIPRLSADSGRPDFNPTVDFNQEIVVGVVGQPHHNLCRKTNFKTVDRDTENGLTVNLEEVFTKECRLSLPILANPVILIKVKRPVAVVKIGSSKKEIVGE